ncbi:hypothetical protein OPV22_003152 [Ensete ventricosum]|uniref:Rho-GAP domain-containing protein n=1 Tax=Ensete ventricosum TaxID=4639 RepID=A0AAV8RZR4_ENSVE|nr:hypothetical protein OPV22_003152 [Ensete ventricosum]
MRSAVVNMTSVKLGTFCEQRRHNLVHQLGKGATRKDFQRWKPTSMFLKRAWRNSIKAKEGSLGVHARDEVSADVVPELFMPNGRRRPLCSPSFPRENKDPQQISTLQLKKGVRKDELTFVAAVKLEPLDGEVIHEPAVVANVLKEFIDIMPPELPKTLPPRRGVDHNIELESGVKPPARPPYRMASPELAELRKQLDELLSGGLICSSKAPFGALVLFQKK